MQLDCLGCSFASRSWPTFHFFSFEAFQDVVEIVFFSFRWSAAVLAQGLSEAAVSAHENQQSVMAKFQVNVSQECTV